MHQSQARWFSLYIGISKSNVGVLELLYISFWSNGSDSITGVAITYWYFYGNMVDVYLWMKHILCRGHFYLCDGI